MLGENRGFDHRPVPGQNPGVVGDQEGSPGGGYVLDPCRLDAPVVAVQRLENSEKRFRKLRIEAEVVDRVIRPPARKLALLIDELDHFHDPVQVDHVPPGELAQSD